LIGALYRGSVAATEHKHWFAGPELYGFRVPQCVGWPLEFIMKARKALPGSPKPRITIAGYSRGAYSAIRVAQGLGKAGIEVDLLILLDTVKVTIAGTEAEVAQVIDRYDDSFDIADDAKRNPARVYTRGGVYADQSVAKAAQRHGARLEAEIYRADSTAKAEGSWNAIDSPGRFVVPSNVKKTVSVQRDPMVRSRDWTMGVSPVEASRAGSLSSKQFLLSHSAMGGMPFRGDLPSSEVTRFREWKVCGLLVNHLRREIMPTGAFQYLKHPTAESASPPATWLRHPGIRAQYEKYYREWGSDGLTPDLDRELDAWSLKGASRK